MNARYVVDLLVQKNILQPSQADDVLEEASLNGRRIDQILLEGEFVDQRTFYQVIANALGTEFIDLTEFDIPLSVVQLVPSALARLRRVLPIALREETLHIALSDPTDLHTPEDLRFALIRNVHVVVAPVDHVELLIQHHYGLDTPD